MDLMDASRMERRTVYRCFPQPKNYPPSNPLLIFNLNHLAVMKYEAELARKVHAKSRMSTLARSRPATQFSKDTYFEICVR